MTNPTDAIDLRRCTVCSHDKPLSEYGRKSKYADGKAKRCMECCRVIARRDYHRKYGRKFTQEAKA